MSREEFDGLFDVLEKYAEAERLSGAPCSIATKEVAKNIRRNIKLIHKELRPGDDRDSSLIDLVNHIDALAQQIELGN